MRVEKSSDVAELLSSSDNNRVESSSAPAKTSSPEHPPSSNMNQVESNAAPAETTPAEHLPSSDIDWVEIDSVPVETPSTSQNTLEDGETKSFSARRGIYLPVLDLTSNASRSDRDSSYDGPFPESEPESPLIPSSPLIDSPYSIGNEILDRIKEVGNDGEGPCTLMRSRRDQQLRVVKRVTYPTLIPSMGRVKPIEARILQDIFPQRHNNLIDMYNYVYFDNTAVVYYSFEYCSGGDLHDLVCQYENHHVRLPEPFIWKVFSEIASALEFLHLGFDPKQVDRLGVVHRDIKPMNIFLRRSQSSYPEAVLADFGSASFDFATYEPAGTFSWQPPEIPRKSPKGDVWALGAVVHDMIHLKGPFADLPPEIDPTPANREIWAHKPEARRPILEVPEMYSEELVGVMLKALEPEYKKRLSSRRLVLLLKTTMGKKEENEEALAPWAFDHMSTKRPPMSGRSQYFYMMEKLEGEESGSSLDGTP